MATRKAKTSGTKRARKPRSAGSKTAVEDNAIPPVDAEGYKYLSALDLARLDLLDHKIQNAQQARMLMEREKKDAIDKFDAKIAALMAHERQFRAEGVNIRKALGEKYDVNFFAPEVSYDDVSGRIYSFGQVNGDETK